MKPRSISLALAVLALTQGAIAYDNFLVGRLAPLIARGLGAPLSSLAGVFVLQQAGLAAGAFLAGLLGNRLGPRRVLVAGLVAAGLATLATPLVRSVGELAALRTLVGVALGMAAPMLVTTVVATASDQFRNWAIALTLACNPVGAAAGSLMATQADLPGEHLLGFVIGGVVLLALAGPLLLLSPRQVRPDPAQATSRPSAVFVSAFRPTTLRLGVCFFLTMGLIALLAAWQPSYFEDLAGVPLQRFSQVAVFAAPGAVAGMLLSGAIAARLPRTLGLLIVFFSHGLALALVGTLPFGSAGFAAAYVASVGFQAAEQGLLNFILAERYPDGLRATAFGFACGMGRIGGIFGPWLGAIPIGTATHISAVYWVLAATPLVVAGVLLSGLRAPGGTRPSVLAGAAG